MSQQDKREAGMMITSGTQGVGKTYQSMYTIYHYCQDNLKTKIKGRRCLIFDTNGEYTKEQFEANGIKNFNPKLIAVKDVEAWSRSSLIECRRIDAKSVDIPTKVKILQHLIQVCRNMLLVVEDINTYILQITHNEEIVGGLVNLRHKAVDVLVSFQSLRAVEPRFFANCRWIRMHFQNDNVMSISEKLPNIPLIKIAQYLIADKHDAGDIRFFVYILLAGKNKIIGEFTEEEFLEACKKYAVIDKSKLREQMDIYEMKKVDAIQALGEKYNKMFNGLLK